MFGSGSVSHCEADSEAGANTFNPSVKTKTLPAVIVNEAGQIKLPYIGVLKVLGKTSAVFVFRSESGT